MIRSFLRCATWLLICAVVVFTLAPIQFRPATAAPANWERFAAFTVIGALLCVSYPRHRLHVVGLVIGLAGLLELLQHLSPTRHGQFLDGLVKAVGAIFGVALAAAAECGLKHVWTRRIAAQTRAVRPPKDGTVVKS